MDNNSTQSFQASLRSRSLILNHPVVLGSLLAIAYLAWLYLLSTALDFSNMARVGVPGSPMDGGALVTSYASWSLSELLITATMWIAMMSAMMLPTAIPMTLVFADDPRGWASPMAVPAFVLGYVLVWTGYALAAVAVQWMLLRRGLFQPDMKIASDVIGGGIFIAAGVYEWSPLKRYCLDKCRNPREFIASQWRPGAIGALRVGLRHGVYCLGCYWALMLLPFVVGALNLIWVAALSLLVLFQKTLLHGEAIARASGLVMLVAGIYLIVQAML
jgi:predicted metal-binding membrane protein